MGAFGERLRRERELRGISLDQIVATTKIGRRLLQALEDEQFDLLPGGIFNKSYVRAYAKCVGINEDEAVADYLQAAQEAPPDTRVIAHQHASLHSDRPVRSSGFPVLPVLILLVVIAGGVGGWKVYQDHLRSRQPAADASSVPAPAVLPASTPAAASSEKPPTKSDTQPPTKSESTAPAVKPVASAAAPASSAATTSSGRFEVSVVAKDRAWVAIKVDGKYVVRGIIDSTEPKTVHGNDEIVVYTSNAGAIEVSFGGKNVPLTAGRGEEETLVFDAHGLRAPSGAQ